MSTITAEQVRALWMDPNPAARIDRGDDYEIVTQDDLGALASELDTDDDGVPLDDQWQVLADQLNTARPGEASSSAGEQTLQHLRDARAKRESADAEFYAAIRDAMVAKRAPVTAMAKAAGYSRARMYQIKDGEHPKPERQ